MPINYRLCEYLNAAQPGSDYSDYHVIARSVSDVAISSSALEIRKMPLNIENPKCTMLIGADGIDSLVLEIATSPPWGDSSQ